MRALGLDVGERRIGAALSDPDGIIATALPVIEVKSEGDAVEKALAQAREHEVERIVVGMPLSLDGTVGPQARRVQDFVKALAEHTDLIIETWDERFTSKLAGDGKMKGKARGRPQDSVAACYMLQSYLDSQTSRRGDI